MFTFEEVEDKKSEQKFAPSFLIPVHYRSAEDPLSCTAPAPPFSVFVNFNDKS
jgi:hypothetical protein